MGWAGISIVRVPPGRTAEQAISATIAGTIEIKDDGLQWEPNPAEEEVSPSPETEEWMDLAIQLLTSANPELRTVETKREDDPPHLRRWVVLADDAGPVYFDVYPSEVMMKPTRDYQDPEGQDGAGFAAMWRYCQLFGTEAGCVAHDPDYDQIIDLSLDEESARAAYCWM